MAPRTILTTEQRREKALEWRKQWAIKNPGKRQTWNLKNKYGITSVEYNKLFKRQRGVCAVCRKPPGKKRLAVDHCHITGVIRGLLCARCNMLLGYALDSPDTLRRAARYLTREIRKPMVVKGMQRASDTVLAPVQAPASERVHESATTTYQDSTSPWPAALSPSISIAQC